MTLDALDRTVGQFCAEWAGVSAQIITLDSSCGQLTSELNGLKETIGDLIESRRLAPKSEKRYYRERIREARETKDEVVDRLHECRAALARAQTRQAELRRAEKELRHSLSTELRRAASGAGKLAASPAFIGGRGISALSQKVREHHLALQHLGRHLDETVKGSGDSELVYLPEPPEPTFWPARDATGRPLDLIEPPRFETYLTRGGEISVPTSIYSIYDTYDVNSLSQEHRGTFYAESYLRSMGHPVVLPIGGAGVLDMLSIDSTGQLWVTEVKETETGRRLAASGLDRQYSVAGQTLELQENEPSWLLRDTPRFSHVDSVLEALKSAIETVEDPAKKEGLRMLRDAYSEAAREGFTPLSTNKSLIQVGFSPQTGELAPPEISKSRNLDEWIANVEPKNIIQIEVATGSKNSEIGKEVQTGNAEGGAKISEATSDQSDSSSGSGTGTT